MYLISQMINVYKKEHKTNIIKKFILHLVYFIIYTKCTTLPKVLDDLGLIVFKLS